MGVQVGLEVVEAVEVVLARHRIAGPRRLLHARKDHPLVPVLWPLRRPEIPVVSWRRRIAARLLEPGMLIGRVIADKVDDDAKAELARVIHELDEVARRTGPRMYAVEVGDIVAVVLVGRRIERQQPQAGDAKPGEIRQPFRQSGEITDTVAVAVDKGFDVQAVDDGVLVPEVMNHATDRSNARTSTGLGIRGSGLGTRDQAINRLACHAEALRAGSGGRGSGIGEP